VSNPVSPSKRPSPRRSGVFIGRYFGIEFYLDYSWFLIAAFFVYKLTEGVFPKAMRGLDPNVYLVMGASAGLLFFLSILLHELGHSLVSQRCGIPVPRITLLLIGGLAEISREPDDAKTELKIALGGPVVSVLLAVLYWLGSVVFAYLGWSAAELVCQWLMGANIILILFNLVPGYPLDGGRVLRAILWARTGKLRWATFMASRVGIGFAWFLTIAGLWMALIGNWTGLLFIVIALFLKSAAESGYSNALQRELLAGVKVRDIMTPNPVWIPATLPLSLAIDEFFLTNHHIAFPVCTEEGEFRGLLRLEFVKNVSREKWPYTLAGDVVAERGAETLSVDVETPAARGMRLLLAAGSGRLAVTENGRLVGIVTRHDILHFIKIHNELEE
jgi:Zn-dependent protease